MAEQFVTVKFVGGEQLQETLKRLPLNIARRLLREAILKAVGLWKEEMELRAPKLENTRFAVKAKYVRLVDDLSRNIGVKLTVNSDLEGFAQVGPSRRTFWAIFLEFGTKKMRAMPFIVPAYEAMKEAVLAQFVREGQRIVAEEAAKHV
jgi:HK97 gp10 family phage protein